MSPDPWWQMAKTSRLGLILGTLYLALAVVGLPFMLLSDSVRSGWLLMSYVLFGLLGIAHLASAVALRRRGR